MEQIWHNDESTKIEPLTETIKPDVIRTDEDKGSTYVVSDDGIDNVLCLDQNYKFSCKMLKYLLEKQFFDTNSKLYLSRQPCT